MKYLDVRTAQEFAGGHAPGAVHAPVMVFDASGAMVPVPVPSFLAAVKALIPDTNTPLLVGCKAGGRSTKACQILAEAGFTALTNVEGGWGAWEAAGLPVEK